MNLQIYMNFWNRKQKWKKTMKQQRAEIWPEALPRQHGSQPDLDQMARP
jgi:hypothetical protein